MIKFCIKRSVCIKTDECGIKQSVFEYKYSIFQNEYVKCSFLSFYMYELKSDKIHTLTPVFI